MLELTTTRLAEGLRSLALDELVTMVRDEIDRDRNLPVNMGAPPKGAKNTCDHYCHTTLGTVYYGLSHFFTRAQATQYTVSRN